MKPTKVIEKRDEHFAYGSVLEAVSKGLYPDRKHVLREFIQNAFDALGDLRHSHPKEPLRPVEITASAPSLIIADKGIGMSEEAMRRYRYLGFSEKQIGLHAGFRGIGKFSAITVCDRLIVRSSRLGEPKSYQVEIDAAGMWKRLQTDRNPPLESLLQDHSTFAETDEKPELHYTFAELHGVHGDAMELLDANIIKPYLAQTAPVPFEPAFPYGAEISQRLHQVNPEFLEVGILVNREPVYKPFLADASRPDYKEVFAAKDPTELIALAWFCQHLGKGQFRDAGESGKRGQRHPHSGLHYRASNFTIGDSMLTRKTLWQTTPERAFYFFGEIHVLDSGVTPTSDRDNFEDTSARGRLYDRCREISAVLSFRAGLKSQQLRFGEVVASGEGFVTETVKQLQAGQLESELKEEKEYEVQKFLEDLAKRLKQSSRSSQKDEKNIRRARRVQRKAQNLYGRLKSNGNGHRFFVDITKDLKMDPKTKAVYEAIISVLREEFRQEPGRFAAVVRKIHDTLRKGIKC